MSGERGRLRLERTQVWVYLGAIAAGLLLGGTAPGAGAVAEVLIWPVLVLLLFVTFVQVPLLHLREAVRDVRFAAASLVGNFVVVPLLVWALLPLLPGDPAVRLGVLLVLLVPCTDWFVSFTQLGGGDVPRAIAVTPVNLVLQLLLLPLYLLLVAGTEVSGVASADVVAPALLVVLVPLLAAAGIERWVGAQPSRRAAQERLAWTPVPLLAVVVLLVATAQVGTVLGSLAVLPVVVPVFAAFLVAAAVTAKVLATALSLPGTQGRTLAFGLGTRNSFVVLPLALALPEGFEVVAVVVVVQSLVELLGMAAYVRWVPRWFPATTG